jgi:protein TonB
VRRDLIIALVVSVLLHAGLALGFNVKPAAPAPPTPPPLLEIVTLPPLEPEEPLPADAGEASSDEPAPAPTMQADLPSVRLDSPFVQPVQPAPPDLGRPTGLVTVPTVIGTGAGNGLGNIFSLSDLDQPPTVLLEARLKNYPYEMRRAGISGEVELEFMIDAEGNARDVRVLRSTHREFEAAAIATVLASKFTPGKKGGRAVATSRVTRTITFNLTGAD